MLQVYLKAIGCRLNEAELESWGTRFRDAGHRLTTDPLRADLMVFNSCAVTREAERKSRQSIRRLHRDNPRAKLVMTGCYASLGGGAAAERLGVDLVIGNADKDDLVAIVGRELAPAALSAAATEPGAAALFARGRQRAFVKVQDGCRYRCTYCIVTVARGEERSRAIGEVVAEVNALVAGGVREVVLTGVHVGGYGSDTGESLATLIRALLDDTGVERLRLASVEPWDLPADFFDLFADTRLMPHMHLPLQSGCDSVLRRMARRCKTGEFRALVERARSAVADFNVTTDIIVGFPGESAEEWATTLAFAGEICFGHIHVFSFSAREGTKAARLPEQVDGAVKRERSRALHELAQRCTRTTLARFAGRRLPVLWEGEGELRHNGRRRYLGYTPNMLRVCTEVDAAAAPLTNRILPTDLRHDGHDLLHGEVVDDLREA